VTGRAIEIVRAFYAAYEAGDLAGREGLLDPHFEFLPHGGMVVHGRDGLQESLEDMADQFRTYEVRAERFLAVDDATVVVALARSAITHRGDVPITDRFAQLFSVRDGLIVRVQSFRTVDEALAGVGAERN
jgi:ketosteroid isomerase-like protein